MGQKHLQLDLSPANIERQDHLLFRTFRESGGSEIPHNHFWTVVYQGYYLGDIRRTGNDHHFILEHPVIGPILRHYHEFVPPTPLPPCGPGTIVCPPPQGPPVHPPSVPEPSSWVLMVAAIATMIIGRLR